MKTILFPSNKTTLKVKNLLFLLIGLFSFFIIQAQDVIFFEDFEDVGPVKEFFDNQASINGIPEWQYEKTECGRIQFDIGYAISGYHCALLDANVDNCLSENSLIVEIDMSAYDLTDNIELSFHIIDFDDENMLPDYVYVRGSNSDDWIVLYNLLPDSYTDETWTIIENIDVTSVLQGEGQDFTSTFQLKFLQYDNYSYNAVGSSDGIAFDDITLKVTPDSVRITEILTPVSSSCGNSSDSITISVENISGVTLDTIPLLVSVEFPNSSTQDIIDTLFGPINNGEIDTITVSAVNTTATGDYYIVASSNYPGAINDNLVKVITIQDEGFPIPYTEDFDDDNIPFFTFGDKDNYIISGGELQSTLPADTVDSIITPKIYISESNYFFNYVYADFGSIDNNDTIFVQIATSCGFFNTIDTIYSSHPGIYGSGEYFDLSLYINNPIIFKFLIKSDDGLQFDLNTLTIRNGLDCGATDVLTTLSCVGDENDLISVEIENFGLVSANNIPVELQITNPNTGLMETFNATYSSTSLSPPSTLGAGDGGVGTVLVTSYNTSVPNTNPYQFIAFTDINNDADNSNDLIGPINKTVSEADSMPQVFTFNDNQMPTGWTPDDFGVAGGELSSTANITTGNDASILTYRFANITSNTNLFFKYLVTTNVGNALGNGDTIFVEVSDDCNDSYDQIYTIHPGNDSELDELVNVTDISLATYAGKDIYIRFLATKSAVITTNYYNVSLDDIKVIVPPDYDFGVIDIITSDPLCGLEDDEVEIAIECFGANSPASVPVRLIVTDPDDNEIVYNYTINKSFSPGERDTITVSGINTLAVGTYTFDALTDVVGDNVTSNDTLLGIGKEIYEIQTSLDEKFDGTSDFPTAWDYDNQTSTNPSFVTNYLNEDDTAYLRLPEIGPIEEDFYLLFNYLVDTDNGDDVLGAGDKIFVQVSEDCGLTYTTISTIDTTTHNPTGVAQSDTVDLSDYIDQNIFIRILATKQTVSSSSTVNFNLELDDLLLKEILDVGVSELNLEGNTCWKTDEEVAVAIENFTPKSISDIPVSLEVKLENSQFYADTTYTIDTIITNLIGYTDTETIIFIVNTRMDGKYTFKAYTGLDGDTENANDTLTDTKSIEPVYLLPYSKTGSFGDGEWNFTFESTLGNTSVSNDLYEGDIFTTTSPRIGPLTTSYLSFDYLIYSNNGGTLNGQIGKGDTIFIQISDSCDELYTTYTTITSANHTPLNDFQPFDLDLSAFSGKEISIRIKAVKYEPTGYLTNYYRLTLDNIEINSGIDAGITGIILEDDVCGTSTEDVTVEVTNYGAATISNIPVELSITWPNGTTIIKYGTLAGPLSAHESQNLIFNNINTLLDGVYEFDAITNLDGDLDNSNDLYSDFSGDTEQKTIFPLINIAYIEPFDDDFEEEIWQGDNTFNLDNETYVSDTIVDDEESYFITPPIGTVSSNTNLIFDYLIVSRDLSNQWGNILGLGDTIFIMVSTDCEETWDIVDNIIVDNHTASDQFAEKVVDLSGYNGSNIMIQVKAVKNIVEGYETSRFAIFVDNLKVIDDPDYDYGISEITESTSLCGKVNDYVEVVVNNFGADIYSGDIQVDLEITNPYDEVTIKSKTTSANIASGSSTTLTFNVNTSILEGNGYIFKAYTSLVEDNLNENDTAEYAETFYFSQLAFVEDFDGGLATPGEWDEEKFNFANNIAKTDTIFEDSLAMLRTPRLGPLAENSYLLLDYLIETDLADGEIGPGDTIFVKVSNDCGLTWQTTDTLHTTHQFISSDTLEGRVNLLDFAGEEVYVKFIISKSPDLSSTTEYMVVSIDSMYIDTIFDVQAVKVIVSELTCGSESDVVGVSIYNATPISISDIPIELVVELDDDSITSYFENITSLESYTLDTVLFTINTSEYGTYTFSAITQLDGDTDNSNDTATVDQAYNEPVEVAYEKTTGFNDGTWMYDNMAATNSQLTTNNLSVDDTAYILSPRVAIPSDGAYFYYQYETNNNTGGDYTLGKGDTIQVQISTDCSASYTTLFAYNSSNKIDEQYIIDSIDLSSYAGQIVAIRFLAFKSEEIGSATTWFNFEIDDVFVNNGKDVGANQIILSTNDCQFENNIIGVEVENFGQITVNEIPVRLVVTMFPGEPEEYEYDIADTINTPLAGGDKDTIDFSINIDEVGTYEFNAYTELDVDIDNSNDTVNTVASNTVVPLYPIPTMETFDGNTNIEDWGYITNFTNNDEAISSTLSAGQEAVLISRKFGPVPSDYIALSFLYHIQSDIDNLLDNGDSVLVMISNDCGNNYTTIYEINSSTHTLDIDSYFLVTLDISSYIGDDIFVKFVAKNVQLSGDQRANFQVKIDDFAINNGADVGILAIYRNANFPACGLMSDPIAVTIGNYGVLPQTNIPVKIDVFGTLDTTIYATYTDILGPYESDILVVGSINTSEIGVYEIAAQTTLSSDTVIENNKVELTIEIKEPEGLPYLHDFVDNTGWIFDYANSAGIFAPQANLEPGDTAIAVSPKIGPIEENYYLAFDAWFRSISNIATSDENFFRDGDEIEIQVSEDCGYTFTTLFIIDSSNTIETTGQEPYGGISLDSYIGSELIFRIIGRRAASATDDYSMYFEIDNFEVITPDFGVTGFENPVADICGSALDTIEIVVENLGVVALGNIPITVEVTGDEFADVIFTTTIPEVMLPGDDTTLYIGTVNTLYPQDYYFSAYTSVIDDNDPSNDESTLTITIPEVKEVPYVQDFDDWVDNFWTGWSFEATNADWYLINNGDWDLASDILEEDDTATITTTKYGPINNNYLLFDYLIEAYDANDDFVGNYLRRNDTIKVMISDDCGDTYTTIHEINNLNHIISDEFQTAFVDLSTYNGQEIVVKFEIVKGIVGSMEFFFDNFEIQQGDTARVVDVDVISFNEACGRVDDVVMVVVRNFGYNTLTDVPVILEVIAKNTDDISISTTVPGPIGPGERDTVYISPINTQIPGEYKFRAYTTYSENILLNADSITYEVRGLEQLPYTDNFAGALGFVESDITNGNLWWSDGSYARTGKLYNGDSAIAISPKIGPVSAQSILEFDYMIDAYDLSGSMVGNYLRANDSIQLLISVDCEETWEVLYTINALNHIESDEDATLYIDLATYAGQNAIFKFIAIKGTIGTYELKIDYYHVSIPDPNISITQLFDTQEGLCGNDLDSITVEIMNGGNTIFTDVTVEAIVTRTDLNANIINVASFNNNYSINLNPGELDTLYLGAFSTLQTGTYTIDVIITAEGDDDDATFIPINIQGLTTIPLANSLVFNNVPGGWSQDNWNNFYWDATIGQWLISTSSLNPGDTATLRSAKYGPITSNSHLVFDYVVVNGDITIEDSIRVMISTDCGITYEIINVIDDPLNIDETEEWTTKIISLSDYEGEDVIIKFVATKRNIGSYQFAINNFNIIKPDIQISNIVTRSQVICGLENDSVLILVINNGLIEQDSIPVEVLITAQDWNAVTIAEVDYTLSGQLNDPLEPGETDTIVIGPFNSVTPGNYSIEAILQVTDNSINTSFIGALSIQQPQPIPYSEDFESLGVLPGFWYTYNVSFVNLANNYISINNIYQGDEAYIISPKVTGITENSFLYYDYMLLNGGMEVEDTIWVLVSTDCGSSYTIVDTLIGLRDEFGYNVFYTNLVSLAAFSGEDIVVQFQTVKQSNGTYSVAFDNIKIENGNDVGITNIYSQNNAGDRFVTCGTALDSIYITIQNFGKNSQSNIPVVVVKTLQNGTDSTENYTFIPTLDQGETGELLIGTVNTVNPGFVEIIAYTDVTDDYEIENDTLGFVITTQRPYDVPYIALKGNYFNETAYWDLQNIATNQVWSLDLTTLAPTWYAGAPTQNYLQNGDTAYAVTPKIRKITGNSYLVFNYNAYNSIYGHIIYEESIEVQVSNDCGTTYETIQRIDVTNNDTTANAVNYISIGDYAGDEIIIRFEIVKGKSVGFFRVDLDEIVVIDYVPVDLPDDTTIYPFTTITLDAGPNYDSYAWTSLATGNTIQSTSQIYLVTQEGTYIIAVTKNGIISSDTIVITSVVPVPDKPTTQSEIICNRRSSWHTTRSMLNVTMYYWTITPAEAGIVNGNDAIVEITWSKDYYGEVALTVQAVYANGVISDPSEELDLILDACLGIDDIEKSGLITNIYPVPSTGKVFININGQVNEEFEMRIFDIHGKLMNYEVFNYVPVKEIDMAGYDKGVYIIELRSGDDVFYGKAIIE